MLSSGGNGGKGNPDEHLTFYYQKFLAGNSGDL